MDPECQYFRHPDYYVMEEVITKGSDCVIRVFV